MSKIKTVKEIKVLLDKVILPKYKYKTNFSCAEFLVDIDSEFVIIAKPVCTDDEFRYEFALDTQFASDKEITYEELTMIKKVIDILEDNKKFVLSKLKKYKPEEYIEEQKIRKMQSERMLESLKNMLLNN